MIRDPLQAQAARYAGPDDAARAALVAVMLAASYLDFFAYRAQGYTNATLWDARLAGHDFAPDQYRMGVVWLAHLMALHLHIALTMAHTLIDMVSGIVAVLVLFSVFERSSVYRAAGVAPRWFGAAIFVVLIQWFLAWLLWLQKPETLPAVMLVALMLWLWQPGLHIDERACIWRAALVMALSMLLATFRADTSCLLSTGIFLYLVAFARATRQPPLSMPRLPALTVSLLCALLAAGVQFYFAYITYPQANYGRVKMWQFRPNLIHGSRWPPFILFLLPLFWLLVQLGRRKLSVGPEGFAFVTGALCFGALWIAIGKIDEVRIFLPFAFALTPLTAQVAMLRLNSAQTSG